MEDKDKRYNVTIEEVGGFATRAKAEGLYKGARAICLHSGKPFTIKSARAWRVVESNIPYCRSGKFGDMYVKGKTVVYLNFHSVAGFI